MYFENLTMSLLLSSEVKNNQTLKYASPDLSIILQLWSVVYPPFRHYISLNAA